LDQVGVRDDLFELGGDSIAAAEVLVAVRREFGRPFPLAALITAPTIEAMAKLIERPAQPPPTPAWCPSSRAAPSPLLLRARGRGDALAYVRLARHFPPDQPF
jgi:aryl carrier-like protein